MSQYEESFEALLKESENKTNTANLEIGQKIEGKIIKIDNDNIFVDVGSKLDGVMDKKELMDTSGEITVKEGDNIFAFIIKISSDGIRISRSMSGAGVAALEDAQASQLPVEGKIITSCKGGYQVDVLGKRAFCPGSQLDLPGTKNEDIIGKKLLFLVSRVENNGKNIIISHRALKDKEKKENLEKFLPTIKAGDIVKGKITRLTPFGAFLELFPGIEGMIHISELSWSHIKEPADVISAGDEIAVKILDIETNDKGFTRISLSKKQADGDPWDNISEKYKTGEIVPGKVARLTPFGAFVEIEPGIEGLLHLSEMSWGKRVNKPEEKVNIGDVIKVKIKEINPENKKISLSLKDAEGDPWISLGEQYQPGSIVEGRVESKSQPGIFVNLQDGITGLLPANTIKNAQNSAELSKLKPGDTIKLQIQNLDTSARRISLIPIEMDSVKDNDNWKKHAKTKNGQESEELSVMAQALKNAFQKKGSA